MEIQANIHLFRLRFNDEQTKKMTVSTELNKRIIKITRLRQRYEGIAITLNTEKSNEDHVIAHAQYVIQVDE